LQDRDVVGHGTFVAGTVAGKTYGISRDATVVSVKVLGDNGAGSSADVILGIQWGKSLFNLSFSLFTFTAVPSTECGGLTATAINDAQKRKALGSSIINMSLGMGYFEPVNRAVASAVDEGIPVVVAAGNEGVNASTTTPASEPSAITVGAINEKDQRVWNWGPAIDICAPGVGILSAGVKADNAAVVGSGTSCGELHLLTSSLLQHLCQ
jgi:subtilisin family serine protease